MEIMKINIKLNYLKIYIRIYYIFNIKPILGTPILAICFFLFAVEEKNLYRPHHPGYSKENLTGW